MKRQSLVFVIFSGIILVFFGYWIVSQSFNSGVSTGSLGQQQAVQQLADRTNSIFESPIPSQSINWLNATDSVSSDRNSSGALLSDRSNVTDDIAQNLSQDFIAVGGKVSSSSVNDLINKYSNNPQLTSTTSLEFDKPIDIGKLNISSDNSKMAKQSYFNLVGGLLMANLKNFSESEMQQAATDIFEKDDYGVAQQIADVNYQMVDKLSTMPVPSDLAPLHEKLLQSFDNIAYFYTLMVNYKTDPIKFMAAINYFPKVIQEGQELSAQLDNAISNIN